MTIKSVALFLCSFAMASDLSALSPEVKAQAAAKYRAKLAQEGNIAALSDIWFEQAKLDWEYIKSREEKRAEEKKARSEWDVKEARVVLGVKLKSLLNSVYKDEEIAQFFLDLEHFMTQTNSFLSDIVESTELLDRLIKDTENYENEFNVLKSIQANAPKTEGAPVVTPTTELVLRLKLLRVVALSSDLSKFQNKAKQKTWLEVLRENKSELTRRALSKEDKKQ